MKRGLVLLLLLLGFLSYSHYGNAQNPLQKDAINFKVLFLDYAGPIEGDYGDFKNYTNGVEIGYSRNLYSFLNLNVPMRFALANFNNPQQNDVTGDIGALLQAQLWERGKLFVPYVTAGVNGVYEFKGQQFGLQVPAGIGIDVQIGTSAYLNGQVEYRYGLAEDRSNIHVGIGLKYLIGKEEEEQKVLLKPVDFDKDGIPDDEDDCPQIPGLPEYNGCPDTDGDGIPDNEDLCPDIAGSATGNGCPDSDNDGIIDPEDECPNLPGSAENNGCPNFDKDDDGIPDNRDACPDQAGPAATNGCPDRDGDGIADREDRCPDSPGTMANEGCPDTDGDGVHDGIDRCPGTPGDVNNAGCPYVKEEVKEILDFAKRAVQFEVGSATLQSQSYVVLDQIVELMKDNPTYGLQISGHTDSTGDANSNVDLSAQRAKACYDYLVRKGIAEDRLDFVGYGEARPIATNDTANGRSLNRRVEFEVKFK
ncbi:OmpA family protein [Membranihabitans maritimus]|uniref:OmpA family protein n=1 Tax=Membranihabitans maritimus TaxID=2904244 RepID=UPI001F45A261|nr:OmpA family protein [Membranihabitans maritimus]